MKQTRSIISSWQLREERCPCCGWKLTATEMVNAFSGKMRSVVMCRNSKCAKRPHIGFDGDISAAAKELCKRYQAEGNQ